MKHNLNSRMLESKLAGVENGERERDCTENALREMKPYTNLELIRVTTLQ